MSNSDFSREKNSRRRFLNSFTALSLGTFLPIKRGQATAQVHTQSVTDSAAEAARAARLARKLASPQWKDGKFRNELPEITRFAQAFTKMIFSRGQTTPNSEIPTRKRTRTDFDIAPASGSRVTWLGHSTMLVEMGGLRFLTDPVWGERASPVSFAGPRRFFAPPLPLRELPKLDAVIVSHDHYDHLCRETIEHLADLKVPFITTLGVGDRLEKMGVHHALIQEFDWWEEIQMGGVKLACVPARHFSGRTLWDRNTTLWSGWVFQSQQHRIYFSGDTAYFPGFKDIGERYGPFDVVAIESAAYNSAWPDVHIGPEQALQAFLDLKGRTFLPIHWATFSLATHSWTEPGERLIAGAQKLKIDLVLPRPGDSFEPTGIQDEMKKKWWPDIPWETAEQAPVMSTGL